MVFFDVGNPYRVVVSSIEEYKDFIKINQGIKNCYRTVYNYSKLNPEYNYPKIQYESAIIDKIYLDFDPFKKELINGESHEIPMDAFGNMMKVHERLIEEDIKHYIDFTGGGYQIFCLTDKKQPINKKTAIKGFQQEYGKNADPSSFGDISRFHRVIFTKNMKWDKVAIPLNQEYLDKGDKFIRDINDFTNAKREFFGTKLVNLDNYDWPEEEPVIEETNYIDMDFQLKEFEFVPKCVQTALVIENPGYTLRQLFFTYFSELGLTENTIINMIKDKWSYKKLHHSLKEEKQLKSIIKKQIKTPYPETVRKWGLCHKCKECLL